MRLIAAVVFVGTCGEHMFLQLYYAKLLVSIGMPTPSRYDKAVTLTWSTLADTAVGWTGLGLGPRADYCSSEQTQISDELDQNLNNHSA